MRLETNRLILREIRKGDEASLMRNINNLKVVQYLLVVPYPYNTSDAEWFVNKNLEDQAKVPRTSYEFGVTIKPSDEVVGVVGLTKINEFDGTATMGYWLGEDYWRKGYMNEAAKAMIDFAFETINLRRINIDAFVGNEASNGLITKLGFTFEGMRRKLNRAKATGEVRDVNVYGMLKEDWLANKSKSV